MKDLWKERGGVFDRSASELNQLPSGAKGAMSRHWLFAVYGSIAPHIA